ncbi:MAG TPA: hypothetical protein VEK11_05445 [Thermoanaerobaculia bacterium]|jgi:hypothetical protein|nr:hypothetical protein [Thermoanaerobaculia bacterium]
MARSALLALTFFLLATTAAADVEGGWTAQYNSRLGKVHLLMTRSASAQTWQSYRLEELAGLTAAQIDSATAVPVTFQLRPDAGTFTFEGTFRNGRGGGRMTFTPNRDYASQIGTLGLQLEKGDDVELFRLGTLNVSVPYLREMHAIYPAADLRELTKLKAVGVDPAYLRDMRAVGVNITSASEARKLAGSGVTPAFVRELADAGYRDLSVRDLSRLAATGADAKFIRSMQPYKQ